MLKASLANIFSAYLFIFYTVCKVCNINALQRQRNGDIYCRICAKFTRIMRPHGSHIPYYDEKTPLSSQVPQPTYYQKWVGCTIHCFTGYRPYTV